MQFKSIALLAAVVSSAFAAETTSLNSTLTSTTSIAIASGCSFKKTYTATAQSDLDELASCDAIKGDILITGDIGSASIANVKAIYGSLSIYNATSLSSFAADSLTTITEQLEFYRLTILSTVSFGSLVSVGSINWVTLPALTATGFSASVTDCQSLYISDTQLNSLDGFNPTTLETFNVNNNLDLATIESDIESVSSSLSVSYNGENTEVVFDKLAWANNMTFYSVSSISMSNITVVNSSAGFFESNVESLDFSTLTKIGGDLSVENNEELTDVDFSSLTSVGGGFVFINNTQLESVDKFDKLKSIAGAVIIEGDFANFTLPKLTSVRGGFTLESTGDLDCDSFDELYSKGYIDGDKYTCSASTSTSSSSSSTKSSTKSSSSGSASATASASDESTSTESSSSSAGGAIKTASVFGALSAMLLALL
ncbi:hypothetical protein CANARDRAFT_28391 [[Candida] arabinofermentans NRRL YB-2248]|uniref:Receptor L-domain domain-containing protein n=1 Tax=[Candida] arabinofermentans NRRL YB-2248 TaxID=983967 RepID=A0A1E4T1K0_9ASCO|nr:hypothetical protein CANARDRAFT_28391 [[Candida] arabinofermentans NRRL YB-2248]